MKFYVFAPTFHIRPRNTDWIYNKTLSQISLFNPNVEIYLQQSFERSFAYNTRAAIEILKNRLHLRLPQAFLPEIQSRFSLRDLRSSGADLIFGHSPTNVNHLPLICHTGPIFEDALRARNTPEEIIQREKREKLATVERSQLITLNSEVAADTVRAIAGNKADRVRSLPFFLPHLVRLPVPDVEQKFLAISKGERIKLLFVGREAKRKGLPLVLEAFQRLDAELPGRLQLEIVSTFADGPVEIPKMDNVLLQGETAREQVTEKMRQAHALLMPSRFETFGWVYLEAMTAGAVALASDQPTQREILDNGRAGLLVGPTADSVVRELLPLLREPGKMLALALAGQRRIASEYDPYAVAQKFEELGLEAKDLFQADRR